MDKAARDNRANQLNPNNPAYYSSRGISSSSPSGHNRNPSSDLSSSTYRPTDDNSSSGANWVSIVGSLISLGIDIYNSYSDSTNRRNEERNRQK